jgi:hypothetical protein
MKKACCHKSGSDGESWEGALHMGLCLGRLYKKYGFTIGFLVVRDSICNGGATRVAAVPK